MFGLERMFTFALSNRLCDRLFVYIEKVVVLLILWLVRVLILTLLLGCGLFPFLVDIFVACLL